MKICEICEQAISKHDKISIIANSLSCLDNNGGYDLLNDFLPKERLFHADCLLSVFPRLRSKLITKPIYTIDISVNHDKILLAQEIFEYLRNIGEKTTLKLVMDFLSQNSDIHSVVFGLQQWFQRK